MWRRPCMLAVEAPILSGRRCGFPWAWVCPRVILPVVERGADRNVAPGFETDLAGPLPTRGPGCRWRSGPAEHLSHASRNDAGHLAGAAVLPALVAPASGGSGMVGDRGLVRTDSLAEDSRRQAERRPCARGQEIASGTGLSGCVRNGSRMLIAPPASRAFNSRLPSPVSRARPPRRSVCLAGVASVWSLPARHPAQRRADPMDSRRQKAGRKTVAAQFFWGGAQ